MSVGARLVYLQINIALFPLGDIDTVFEEIIILRSKMVANYLFAAATAEFEFSTSYDPLISLFYEIRTISPTSSFHRKWKDFPNCVFNCDNLRDRRTV